MEFKARLKKFFGFSGASSSDYHRLPFDPVPQKTKKITDAETGFQQVPSKEHGSDKRFFGIMKGVGSLLLASIPLALVIGGAMTGALPLVVGGTIITAAVGAWGISGIKDAVNGHRECQAAKLYAKEHSATYGRDLKYQTQLNEAITKITESVMTSLSAQRVKYPFFSSRHANYETVRKTIRKELVNIIHTDRHKGKQLHALTESDQLQLSPMHIIQLADIIKANLGVEPRRPLAKNDLAEKIQRSLKSETAQAILHMPTKPIPQPEIQPQRSFVDDYISQRNSQTEVYMGYGG